MKKISIVITTSFALLAILLVFTASPVTQAFSGHSSCTGSGLVPGQPVECGIYYVIDLKTYLNSDNPSGTTMNVGVCVPTGGGHCSVYDLAITPGHYGTEFIAPQDSPIVSWYQNPSNGPSSLSFSGTDYWLFN